MKQLSEFKNEEGVKVVAKLLSPISNIVRKMKEIGYKPSGTPIDFLSKCLEASTKDVMEIFAILSETPVEEYQCNGASLLKDTVKLASDKEFMELFGLQGQTQTSSGSVSENTEAQQN